MSLSDALDYLFAYLWIATDKIVGWFISFMNLT